MQNQGIEDMHEISEKFADAGMHFYFSGHLHLGEISPWVSDRGETFYDIIVPGLYSFPGDYRVVNFSAAGGRVEADIRSYAPDEVLPVTANGITYTPYYPAALEYSFGYGGEGLTGFLKANLRQALTGQLNDLQKSGGITQMVKDRVDLGPLNLLFEYLDERLINNPQGIIDLLEGLVDEAFALPVSRLPCTRFIDTLGFGDPKKPGTLEDAGKSVLAYMFWKKDDPKDDPFLQDVLRRMKNGALLDQVLGFALPRVLEVLGAEIVPLLAGVDIALLNRALGAGLGSLGYPLLLLLALLPGVRGTISDTLYTVANTIVTGFSPTGSRDGAIVYDGPVAVPTGHNTFRLPQDIQVSRGLFSAQITWYTKAGLHTPALQLTDKNGNPAGEAKVTLTTEYEDLLVDQLDLAIMQMMGYNMRAARHTARIENLVPGKTYLFTAGDSEFKWWAGPQRLAGENPLAPLIQWVWQWILGVLRLPVTVWNNRWFR